MSALEQSLKDLCAKHDLSCLNIGYSPDSRFLSYAHCEGQCCGAHGDTVAEAVGNAIAGLHAKRGTAEPIALADEALPELAA